MYTSILSLVLITVFVVSGCLSTVVMPFVLAPKALNPFLAPGTKDLRVMRFTIADFFSLSILFAECFLLVKDGGMDGFAMAGVLCFVPLAIWYLAIRTLSGHGVTEPVHRAVFTAIAFPAAMVAATVVSPAFFLSLAGIVESEVESEISSTPIVVLGIAASTLVLCNRYCKRLHKRHATSQLNQADSLRSLDLEFQPLEKS